MHCGIEPEKKLKKNGNGKKKEDLFEVTMAPPVAVEFSSCKSPNVTTERYVEYLENKVAELQWTITRMEMESISERERAMLNKFHYFVRRIQNSEFDKKARALLDKIWKEELSGVK